MKHCCAIFVLLMAILAFSLIFCDDLEEENVKKSKSPTTDKSKALKMVKKMGGKKEKQKNILHGVKGLSLQKMEQKMSEHSRKLSPKKSEQHHNKSPKSTPKKSDQSRLSSVTSRADLSALPPKISADQFWPPPYGIPTTHNQQNFLSAQLSPIMPDQSLALPPLTDQNWTESSELPPLPPTISDQAWPPSHSMQTTSDQNWTESSELPPLPPTISDQAWPPSHSMQTTSDQNWTESSELPPLPPTISDQAWPPSHLMAAHSDQNWTEPSAELIYAQQQPLMSSYLASIMPDQTMQTMVQEQMPIQQTANTTLDLSCAQQKLGDNFQRMRNHFLENYKEAPNFSGQPKILIGTPQHILESYQSHPYFGQLIDAQESSTQQLGIEMPNPSNHAAEMPNERRVQPTFVPPEMPIDQRHQPNEPIDDQLSPNSPPFVFWHAENANDLNGIFAPKK